MFEHNMEVLAVSLKDVVYIGIVIHDEKDTRFIWNLCSEDGVIATGELGLKLADDNASLVGQVLMPTDDQENVQLLTLCKFTKYASNRKCR